MEAEPVQFLWRRYEERLDPVRRQLARFLHARAEDLVFVQNATAGVNAFVRSMAFKPGEELLTTSLDYNACRNVLVEAARRQGAAVVVAPVPFPIISAEQVLEVLLAKVTRKTRFALVDHVTSDTGIVLPVGSIIAALRECGVETIIDGAHAPGMVNLNLQTLNPAAYTGNLHKWVCAPKGSAFLWVRPEFQERMQPPIISHGNNRPRPGHSLFQDRFDWMGTIDPSAWFSVGEALRFMGGLLPGGWAELRRTNRNLAIKARKYLCDHLEVDPPCPVSMMGALATIPLPARFQNRPRLLIGKLDAEQVGLYDKYKIEVPFSRVGMPEYRYFRISAQIYNAMRQYKRLGEVLSNMELP
jgi:isopenicillin-N epimerase